MVADVMGSVPLNIELWRALTGPKLLAWECFRDRVAHIQLSYDVDSFCTSAGVYIPPANSWHSRCTHPCGYGLSVSQRYFFQTKDHLNILCIICLQGIILTKDILAKYKWKGVKMCCFCGNKESIQHLFIHALFLT
jgi:hypothetical protein